MKEFSFEKYFSDFKIIDKKILENNIKKAKKAKIIQLNSLVFYKNNSNIINRMLNKNKLPELMDFDESLYNIFVEKDKLNNSNVRRSLKIIKKDYGRIYPKIVNNIDKIFTKMNTLPDTTLYRGIHYNDGSNKDNLINHIVNLENNIDVNLILSSYLSQIHYSNEDKINFVKNNTFTENNFMSTSMNMNIAYNFSKSLYNEGTSIILKIDIKESDNIPFIFLSDLFSFIIKNNKNIQKLNNWNKRGYDEFEILLPRGIEFKVTKVEEVKIVKYIEGFRKYYNKKNNYDVIKLVTVKPISYKPLKEFKLLDSFYYLKI